MQVDCFFFQAEILLVLMYSVGNVMSVKHINGFLMQSL
jgi:hypothetical protein